LIQEYAKKRGVEPCESSEQEIVERCMLALINEGAAIVSEGIVARASDIDVVYVQGYGFPTYRGGPMFYADTLGLDKVRAGIRKLAKRYPDLWQESPFISALLKKNTKLSQSKAG
jgi:3-hydroxyacyl-CoA dehydrogenase